MRRSKGYVANGCNALGASLLIAWAASAFCSVQYGSQNRSVSIRQGLIEITRVNHHTASDPIEQSLISDIGRAICPSGFTYSNLSSTFGPANSGSLGNRLGLVQPSRREPVLKPTHICGSRNSWERANPPRLAQFGITPVTIWAIPIWIPFSTFAVIWTLVAAFRRRSPQEQSVG